MLTPLDYMTYWADGMRCWQAVCRLKAEPNTTAEESRKKGLKRVYELIAHARESSPFYAKYYASIPTDSTLGAYPPVKRSTLMANFDDWASDRRINEASIKSFLSSTDRIGDRFLNKYLVWTSSGTSGEKGIYVQDIEALSIYQSLLAVRYNNNGQVTGRSCSGSTNKAPMQSINKNSMAMVAALEGHFAGIVFWKWASRMNPWLTNQTRTFSILQPVSELVEQLNQWQPKFLSSYPSMLSVLAKEQESGRLNLSPSCLWCGGEQLNEQQKLQIKAAFACKIVEDYGASEAMNMAFSCEHGKLHINTDWFILEPVDAQMQAVPVGEKSVTTLVTNLANRVQPIIRYDIGDSITLHKNACACSNPLPTMQIVGRNDDTLWLLAKNNKEVPILPLTLNTIVEENAGELCFQIIQSEPRKLSIRTEGDDVNSRRSAFERIRESLEQYFESLGILPMTLLHDSLPPERDVVSGKLNQVIKIKEVNQ
jgi:phenylacetate-coenzyme A ligase PaaK-like adenylate-forming protein